MLKDGVIISKAVLMLGTLLVYMCVCYVYVMTQLLYLHCEAAEDIIMHATHMSCSNCRLTISYWLVYAG